MEKISIHHLNRTQNEQMKEREKDIYNWQVKHIEQGLAAADRGEFATEKEVEEFFKRLTTLNEESVNSLD